MALIKTQVLLESPAINYDTVMRIDFTTNELSTELTTLEPIIL